ncbi:MAG: hypothetical protein K6G56_03795 [Clostridiales bacterium]|nr:hypothetical protein [Clostridiales bacterium]
MMETKIEKIIEVRVSGIDMRVGLRLADTAKFFRDYVVREDCEGCDFFVSDEEVKLYPLICPDGVLTPGAEFYMLMARASSFMLKYGRALFHGVSFLWRGRAWIITAMSGVGKTTQLRHWQKLYGDEIAVINGDKCVMRLEKDGRVFVDPCPWTGKEGDSGFTGGELAGIICLEQAAEDHIERIFPRDSVARIFQQFLFLAESAPDIRSAARIEESIVGRLPVWLLKNLGGEASAILTHDTLTSYEEADHERI